MKAWPLAVAGVPLLMISGMFGLAIITASASGSCGGTAVYIELDNVPAGPIAGFSDTELINAATIINSAADANLPAKAQTIGVMVAIAESELDEPLQDGFFDDLATVDGWQTLAPTLAANEVMKDPDPYRFEASYARAQEIVSALTGATVKDASCGVGGSGAVPASGWANPVVGHLEDGYGIREDPFSHEPTLHVGQDISNSCGTAIYAAGPGQVTFAGPSGGYGNLVVIDHDDSISTAYGHLFPTGIFVKAGDQVFAGENIAQIGNTGKSTGCHLHFEVLINGTAVDPLPVMHKLGVKLGG